MMTDRPANPLETLHYIKNQVQNLEASLRKQGEILQLRGITLSADLFDRLNEIRSILERIEARLVEETTLIGQLRTLAGTSEDINSSLDLDEVLAESMERVITLTEAERGYIILTDGNPFDLQWEVRLAHNAQQAPGTPIEFEGSRSVVNAVLETGEALLTDNAADDPTFSNSATIAAMVLRSVLCVPLKVRDQVIGAVYVDNRLRAGLFTPQSQVLLTAFANQAAIAITNARLYTRVQASIDEIAELKELMDNIFISIGSGVITTDQADQVVSCNAAAESILNQDAATVIGKPLPELMPLSNIDFAAFLQLVREKNQKEILDTELDSPIHGRMSLNVKLSPLKDGNQSTQGVTIVLNDFTERRENEAMLGVMRRYLPPEMVDNIHQIAGLALGGERRVTTCMFVDVRPLATFPTDLRPPQIMEMLNRYLTLATDCIHDAGGVIDKYMGHEIMGLFNSQLNPGDDHAAQAVAAGLQIRDAFIDLYRELGINPDPHFYRVGIHSGVATLGNVGSDIRRDFTAIGDTINLAKRLEENATPGQIILSEDTRDYMAGTPGVLQLADVQLVEREPIKVKGRQQLTRIYEVFRLP